MYSRLLNLMGYDGMIMVLKRSFWYLIFRQMRNRDAAVKSRERKKVYVKNLETKSRYFEGECRRLEHLLQCCYAENHALRLCLQSRGGFGAPMTMQESAVLLLGKACNCKSYLLCFFFYCHCHFILGIEVQLLKSKTIWRITMTLHK